MPRRTLDFITTSIGFGLTVLLLVAGGLLTWGYNFANGNVHDQLAAQQIYFPEKGSDALKSPEIGPYLNKYAGQQLVNGAQAEAYADHFIAVHIKQIGGGKTYSQISAAAQADPTNTQLAAQANTLFKGQTLRSMLLEAYAFWQLGQIALYSAIASFAAAALMLVLSILGLLHLRKVDGKEEILVERSKDTAAVTV
jgi:hypothetical protein